MTVVGLLLAAGAGRRYGMPKVLAAQGLWLADAIRALDAGGCDTVLVALGAAIVEVPPPARPVIVDGWSQGMGVSLRHALAQIGPDVDGVLVHLVDLPDVDQRVVDAVLREANRSRAALVRAVFGGRPGHPVYLGAEHLAAVSAGLSGDVGAGPYLAEHAVTLVECGQWARGEDRDTGGW